MSIWSWLMDPIRRRYYRSAVGTEGLVEPPTTEAPSPEKDGTPLSGFADWVWPLPKANGNYPTVSDGYGVRKRFDAKTKTFKGHFGADIMYPRRSADKGRDEVKASPRGTVAKNFLVYTGVPVICVGPGQVFSAQATPTGTAVKVSHLVDGRPVLSVYRHLQNSLVKKGQIVEAGTPLGMPGDNPATDNDPPHLHFELWDTAQGKGYPEWNIDPMSVARPWQVVRLADGQKEPYAGSFRFNPTTPGRTRLVSILFLLGAGGLLAGQILKSGR